jgi:serine/threonine protein kinase
MTLAAETLASRYRLVALVGRGGASDVYRAIDEHTGQTVAVKVVRSGDEDQARRLAREAETLRGLDHPNLVRFLDAGTLDAQAYLIMSFVEGSTLAELLAAERLDPATTIQVAQGVAQGLAYIHSRGVVHRDIKPANILVATDGQVRLGDFGIARVMDASTLTLDGTTVGTVAYMAPEQLEHHVVGPEADVWSLGAILLECLLGRRLFSGSPAEVIAQRMQRPVVVPAAVGPEWRELLEPMLDPVPQHRWTAAEVARRLGAPTPTAASPWGAPAADAAATTVLDLAEPTSVYTAADAPLLAARPARADEGRRRRLAVATGSAAVVMAAVVALAFGVGDGHAARSPATTLAPTTVATVPTTAAPTTAPPTTTPPPPKTAPPPPKHHHGGGGPGPGDH